MRNIVIVGLIVLNAVLAVAAFAPPGAGYGRDCCKGNGPEAYCCEGCCFLGGGCSDCEVN